MHVYLTLSMPTPKFWVKVLPRYWYHICHTIPQIYFSDYSALFLTLTISRFILLITSHLTKVQLTNFCINIFNISILKTFTAVKTHEIMHMFQPCPSSLPILLHQIDIVLCCSLRTVRHFCKVYPISCFSWFNNLSFFILFFCFNYDCSFEIICYILFSFHGLDHLSHFNSELFWSYVSLHIQNNSFGDLFHHMACTYTDVYNTENQEHTFVPCNNCNEFTTSLLLPTLSLLKLLLFTSPPPPFLTW
jgi:hypothetical protein